MTLTISVFALLISLGGFAFNLYQFANARKLRAREKANEILHKAFALRKLSQDLRQKISVTDHVPDMDDVLDALDAAIEGGFTNILTNKDTSLHDLLGLEQRLKGLELEHELLSKQVDAQEALNNEVRALEK